MVVSLLTFVMKSLGSMNKTIQLCFIVNARCFCFRAEYECFQIELAKNYGVPEWREDLKKVLLKSGVENKSMVFLFSDTQVIVRQ